MICRYIVWFIITSFFGWLYETFVMTLWEGKWDNRGFLYSPICPIYGTGVVAIFYLCEVTREKGITIEGWKVFLFAMVGSAILEFITSVVLEKLFHATWWDYSIAPFNIQGRVCLFASIGFGLAGLALYMYGYDLFLKFIGTPSDRAYTLGALLSVAVLSADVTATSFTLLSFNNKLKTLRDSLDEKAENAVGKVLKDRAARDVVYGFIESSRIASIGKMSYVQKRALERISLFKVKSPAMMKNAVLIFDNIGLKSSKVKLIVKKRLDRTKKLLYNKDDSEKPSNSES